MKILLKILLSAVALLLCASMLFACNTGTDLPSGEGGADEIPDTSGGGDTPDTPGGGDTPDTPGGDTPDPPGGGDTPDTPDEKEENNINVYVVGGALSGGGDSGSFSLGDTVSITASSDIGFIAWVDSSGKVVSADATFTFTVTMDSVTETYTAMYSEAYPMASFDDMSLGEEITKDRVQSGGVPFYHAQSSSASEVTVVRDPRGSGNVLRFEKTDKTKGETVYFKNTADGKSCFVLEFDIRFESTACSVPLQINMGSCYRLQLSVTQDFILFNDAKTDGSEVHFLGAYSKFGDWIRVRVEYFPGDLTEAGQYAKVYFNDTLTAISQNSAKTTISSSFDAVRFYQLISSDAVIYLDNVSVYSTDDTYTDTDEDVIRIIHGDTADSDFENRFLVCEAVLGKEVASELRELCSIFDEDVYIWLARLYDPETAGFYYSNDARDFEGFLPDIESTSQAMSFIGAVGLGNVKDIYTDDMKARVVAWVQSLQSDDDGYFYHPQWGTDISPSRRGRDLGNSIGVLNRFGAVPLYPTALDRLQGGVVPTSYLPVTAPLRTSRDVAVSKVVLASTTTTAPHLASEEAFIEYLDNLFATVTTTSESGEIVPNSYPIGNTVSSQASQIKAAGLDKVCIEYFNAMQNPDTGLWEADKNYRTASGLLKISGLYNSLKAEIPYADKAVRSCIDIAASEEPLSAVVYVYNPLSGLSNVLSNLKNYSTSENAAEIRAAAINEMQSRALELIENTHKKLLTFKKADGSFSYSTTGAPSLSQGEPVCFGANEGDVNGTGLVHGTIRSLCACMGISLPAYYSSEDAEKFAELIYSQKPTEKLSVNDLTVDFEKIDPTTGLPKFVSVAAASEGASYALISDTVGGKESRVILLNAEKGKNDNISIKFPATLKEATCYAFSADVSMLPTERNGTTTIVQMRLGSAYMLAFVYDKASNTLRLTDSSSTGTGNKTTNLGVYVPAGEWFNIRVEYYVGDASSVCILVYLNGSLCAVSSNYYGSKIDGEPLPEPAKSVNAFTASTLMAASLELKMDNVHLSASYDTIPELTPNKYDFDSDAAGTVPSGITNSIGIGGSASVARDGEDGYYKIVSHSGAGDSTTVSPSIGIGERSCYVLEVNMHYVASNSTTVTQLFFTTGKGYCFAIDINYSSGGKISFNERTSAGIGKRLIDGIDGTAAFDLLIEYYPDEGRADITVKQSGETFSASTSAYYSDAAKVANLTGIRLYSLKSAELELHIDSLGVYNIIGSKK
ncbi:MAG: hypothetical protein IJE25_08580 [Clostridia bacterium]|nr:hypothetical protein [Clostridia bacterium]